MTKETQLFSEFPGNSKTEWESKIQEDLKGADYKRLITKTIEGIDIKPYYSAEDLENISYLETLPDEFPYIRSSKTIVNDWEIREDITVESFQSANEKALKSLKSGATALLFSIPDELEIGKNGLNILLKDIYIDCVHLNFQSNSQADRIISLLTEICRDRNIDTKKITGSVSDDFLSVLLSRGWIKDDTVSAFDKLASRIVSNKDIFPNIKFITTYPLIFHNSGSSAVQELAFGLSMVAEYVHQLTERNILVDNIFPQVLMNFSVGSNYFMEIAKFRAARVLFAEMAKSWGVREKNSEKVYIHAVSSEWNQTVYDPYVNMLRSTTEGMSAVLGNVDSLSLIPFDSAFRETSSFSERISRNTQIILKEEAHLDKVIDPAAGSYFIESLTNSIINEAWSLFLKVEEQDGYLSAINKSYIQSMIEETARTRDMNLALRKEILLGTNQFPNQDEKSSISENVYDIRKPTPANDKSLIKPLKKYRGAEAFEKLRMKVEKSDNQPVVFLLTLGNPVWRKARAEFSSSFFACAGYKIINNIGFNSVKEGLDTAKREKADIIVLCSSDAEYPELSKNLKPLLENEILVIAGYPKENIEELKAQEIENFISVKSNLLEELQKYNQLLGI